MRNKLRIAMIATALLYLGPLLAGLGGYGWAMVPAFVAIFVLWLIVMRPQLWPGDLASWRRGDVIVPAAAQVAVQMLLVVLCFGIGRGIGGVAGIVPMWSPLFPLALSLVAIPLTRLVWDPAKAAALDGVLDDALRQINDPSHRPSVAPEVAARLDALLSPVLDLPEATPDATAQAAVAGSVAQGRDLPVSVVQVLVERLDPVDPPRLAARRGLILWGTHPDTLRSGEHPLALHAAFAVTWLDAGLLRLFAERALPLIESAPQAWAQFPDVSEIRYSIEETNPPEVNALLTRLAEAIEIAMPADLHGATD